MNQGTNTQIKALANINFSETTLGDRVNALISGGFQVVQLASLSPLTEDVSSLIKGQVGSLYLKPLDRTTKGYFSGGGMEYVVGVVEATALGYFEDHTFTQEAHRLMLERWEGMGTGAPARVIVHAIQDPTLSVTHYFGLPDYEWKEK